MESDRGDGRVSLPRVTYVGGPTALLEWGGLRLLTDPTFDPAGATFAAAGLAGRLRWPVAGVPTEIEG